MAVCPRCGRESSDDARFCSSCGSALATVPVAAREERKVVSVVFVDLVGHTVRSEASDPEDVRATLAPYHARARDELERHGGTVEKFIGDAVMAVFGAPIAHEDDAERAVRAALAVRDAMVESGLDVRVAVDTGEALVALDARAAEGEALVAGDVVNTASRIQSGAPTNGVLVGAATFRATDRAIAYEEAAPVVAKGKAEPVPVWLALGPRARFGVDVGQHGGARLVGRDLELRLLRDAFERARSERSTQLVTLVGAPGLGKSRLVWELFRLTDAEPDFITWRQGRALAYGGGPFGAVAEALRAHVGVLESDTPAQIDAKVAATVEELFDDPRDRQWLAGRLGPVVGLGAGVGGGREESFGAWQRLIEGMADRQPLILVLEDLHWADDGTLDFVEHLVDWTRDVPLLVLCTSRPELLERRRTWGGGRLNSHTIALAPLSDDDTAQLVGALLGRPALPADTQARLVQHAGGNPLYAEEYARMLGTGNEAELPDSVQGMIAARLDLLEASEKRLLQDASVLGKVFWRGGVEALGATDADDALQRLVRKEFVRRERASTMADDSEYAFRHALVRDVAYAQLPRAARAEKHRLAAEWIARSATRPDLVAHHYAEALAVAQASGADTAPLEGPARSALRAAGDRARSLGAFNDATELYRRALDLRPGDAERRELLLAVVAVAAGTIDPGSTELVEAAARESEAVGDFAGAADAETALSLYALFAGDREAGLRHGERSVQLAERSGSAESLAQALAARARFVMLAGDSEAAIPLSKRALELAEQSGLEQTAIDALVTVGTARAQLGAADGIAMLRQAVDRADAINDPSVAFRALNNLADLIHATEGLAASAPVWHQIEELVHRFGMYATKRWFDSVSAWDCYQGGDWDQALRYADEFFRAAGEGHYLDGQVRLVRAWIALSRGDDRVALEELERAADRLRGATDPQVRGPGLVYQASLQLLLGRADTAAPLVDELVGLGPRIAGYAADCTTQLAWLAIDTGRRLEFEPRRSVWVDANTAILDGRFGDAIDLLDATGVHAEAAYARLRRARVEPGPWLDEAEAFYRRVGAMRFLGEIAVLRERAMPRSA